MEIPHFVLLNNQQIQSQEKSLSDIDLYLEIVKGNIFSNKIVEFYEQLKQLIKKDLRILLFVECCYQNLFKKRGSTIKGLQFIFKKHEIDYPNRTIYRQIEKLVEFNLITRVKLKKNQKTIYYVLTVMGYKLAYCLFDCQIKNTLKLDNYLDNPYILVQFALLHCENIVHKHFNNENNVSNILLYSKIDNRKKEAFFRSNFHNLQAHLYYLDTHTEKEILDEILRFATHRAMNKEYTNPDTQYNEVKEVLGVDYYDDLLEPKKEKKLNKKEQIQLIKQSYRFQNVIETLHKIMLDINVSENFRDWAYEKAEEIEENEELEF